MSSHLPKGDRRPTEGLNWGMDGYPGVEFGGGLVDFDLGGAHSSLPEGMHVGGLSSSFGEGLEHFVGEDLSISDYSWLEDVTQDPERLPKNPSGLVIPAIQEALAAHKSTYFPQDYVAPTSAPKAASVPLEAATARAWRELTAGVAADKVILGLAKAAGVTAQTKALVAPLRDAAGLIGKVYLRADAYPKCASGQWNDTVRKQASTKYLIQKTACGGCTHNMQGSCAVFQKPLVAEVPWDKAARVYRDQLQATGRKLASDLSPKEALRQAFQARSATQHKAQVGDRPVQRDMTAGVDLGKATSKLAVSKYQDPLATHSAEVQARRAATAKATVAQAAAQAYSGAPNLSNGVGLAQPWAGDATPTALRQERLAATKAARDVAASRAGKQAAAQQTKIATLRAEVARGVKGDTLRGLVRRLFASVEEMGGHVAEVKALLRQASAKAKVSHDYAGVVQTAHQSVRVASGPSQKEASYVVRWARTKLNEGLVGRSFDSLLNARFSKELLRVASGALTEVRAQHEGLAGHLYVDAQVYASEKGTAGCEKAASLHRANQIPTVLAMPRCGSCAKKGTKENGLEVCRVFNKPLTASVPVAQPKQYQAETIRLANASDAERTASLFAPAVNPNHEFGIGVADLDVGDMPEYAGLDTVQFGDWDLG